MAWAGTVVRRARFLRKLFPLIRVESMSLCAFGLECAEAMSEQWIIHAYAQVLCHLSEMGTQVCGFPYKHSLQLHLQD